ncbi:hypothetical protein SBDP1_970027 [Syntrophobacter sp. SbD1]|nr:hypothetical protein SBDP1_970027 [Syntrophobacter sp. SbD1]
MQLLYELPIVTIVAPQEAPGHGKAVVPTPSDTKYWLGIHSVAVNGISFGSEATALQTQYEAGAGIHSLGPQEM